MRKQTQTKMHPRSLSTVRRFTHVYHQAQTVVHTHPTNHGYFDRGKNLNTPNWSPCWGRDGAGSGIFDTISVVCILILILFTVSMNYIFVTDIPVLDTWHKKHIYCGIENKKSRSFTTKFSLWMTSCFKVKKQNKTSMFPVACVHCILGTKFACSFFCLMMCVSQNHYSGKEKHIYQKKQAAK